MRNHLLPISLCLLIGCAATQREWIDEWPMYQYNSTQTGYVTEGPAPPLQLLWTFPTEGRIVYSPVVKGGTVYFGSRDGNIYAVSSGEGQPVWKSDVGQGGLFQSPLVIGNQVYGGTWTPYYYLYAWERTSGEQSWSMQTGELLERAPYLKSDGQTFYFNMDPPPGPIDAQAKLIWAAMTAEGQKILWKKSLEGLPKANPGLSEELLLISTEEPNTLYALTRANGKLAWQIPLNGRPMTAPVVQGLYAYVGTDEGYLYAITLSTGQLRWRYQFQGEGISTDMALAGDILLLPTSKGLLRTFDVKRMEPGWIFRSVRAMAPPIVVKGVVYVGSESQYLHALQLSTGRELWRYRLGGEILSAPAIYRDQLFVGASDGKMYGFGERHSAPTPE